VPASSARRARNSARGVVRHAADVDRGHGEVERRLAAAARQVQVVDRGWMDADGARLVHHRDAGGVVHVVRPEHAGEHQRVQRILMPAGRGGRGAAHVVEARQLHGRDSRCEAR